MRRSGQPGPLYPYTADAEFSDPRVAMDDDGLRSAQLIGQFSKVPRGRNSAVCPASSLLTSCCVTPTRWLGVGPPRCSVRTGCYAGCRADARELLFLVPPPPLLREKRRIREVRNVDTEAHKSQMRFNQTVPFADHPEWWGEGGDLILTRIRPSRPVGHPPETLICKPSRERV